MCLNEKDLKPRYIMPVELLINEFKKKAQPSKTMAAIPIL